LVPKILVGVTVERLFAVDEDALDDLAGRFGGAKQPDQIVGVQRRGCRSRGV